MDESYAWLWDVLMRVKERDRERLWAHLCAGVFVPLHGPPAWSLVVWATAVH